jgi:hypothetical protein
MGKADAWWWWWWWWWLLYTAREGREMSLGTRSIYRD